MRRVGQVRSWAPNGPLTGFVCLLALLGVLAATTGLDAAGWLAGVACGAGLAALLARALTRHSRVGLGPADSVTLARAVLACGVAALTVDSFGGQAPAAILVTLSTVALVLDGVDGRVARRTDTTSAFGARFDMEVDAFLIMVLSVYVARESGWWVLAMGLARYAFVAAGWVLPWLRGPLPPRQSARVVAAIVGVVLTVAARPAACARVRRGAAGRLPAPAPPAPPTRPGRRREPVSQKAPGPAPQQRPPRAGASGLGPPAGHGVLVDRPAKRGKPAAGPAVVHVAAARPPRVVDPVGDHDVHLVHNDLS